jgi:hypothetical protein
MKLDPQKVALLTLDLHKGVFGPRARFRTRDAQGTPSVEFHGDIFHPDSPIPYEQIDKVRNSFPIDLRTDVYQSVTRFSGARYILSPSLMPKAS